MLAGLLSAVLLALLLNGCGSVLTSEQPPRQDYLLRPYQAAAAPADGGVKPELALSVAVIPGLDTDRILALGVDARLNHYTNARWPDHLPEVLASVLQRSLESSGRFASVEVVATGAADAWTLDLELREFYGIQNAAGSTSSVRVGVAGRLACGGQVHALSVEESARVAEERLAVVVAAHQSALDSVTRQLVDRMQALCAAAQGTQ
jgi:ABC-type uncharacterized transport system auxiliary subunit